MQLGKLSTQDPARGEQRRQRGKIPDRANRPLPRHGDSDTLFAAEVHSLLRLKLSAIRPSVWHASLDSKVRILSGQQRVLL